VYRDNSYILSIAVNKNMNYSTPIMFVPFGVPTTSRQQIITPKKPIPPKPTVQAKPIVEKKVVVPTVKKPTTIAAVAPPSFAKATADTSAHTDVKKIKEIKKEEPVVAQIKKPADPIVKKIEPIQKSAAIDIPKPVQTKETPQIPIAQASSFAPLSHKASEDLSKASADTLDIEQTVVPLVPENALISHNYREVEALRRGAQLQKELVQKWKPPIGISPDCMCEVSFSVSTSGAIEDLKMAKSSGVMMYDISVRQALFAMKMPQWTYGKPLIISFKQ